MSSNQFIQLRQQAGLASKFCSKALAHTHCFGGDPQAPTTNESMSSILSAYANQLPHIMNATGKAVLPFQQQLQDAQAQILPQQDKLQADLYAQYAPFLNEIGQRMNLSNAQAQSKQDASITSSPEAQQLLHQSLINQQMVDPNFYPMQNKIAAGYGALQDAQDPTKLSGAESAQVERGLNRMNAQGGNGNGVLAPLTTIGNAMTFGSALADKQNNYNKTLQTGAALLPQMKSGVDAFQLTTGRPSQTNSGANQFLGVNQNGFGNQALGQTSQVLGMAGQANTQANDINANRRDTLDRFNQTAVAQSSSVGNVCCFIFLEVYNGTLPWYVRSCRDIAYARRPAVARGYIKMAKWLVPLMRRFDNVKELVNDTMVKPLTEHAANISGEASASSRQGYYNFWFTIWNWMGR